jgi:hypothetical protein
MPALRVRDIRVTPTGNGIDVSARLDARRLGWHDERLWFHLPRDYGPDVVRGDAFATALLLPAMAAGLDLTIDAPVSASLSANLDRVQALLTSWNPHNPWARLHRIDLSAPRETAVSHAPPTTGLFFTGGVDSIHSLLQAERETGHAVDLLLFVQGFDVPLDAPALAASVEARVRAAAAAAARPVLVVRTNLRQFTDPVVSWEMMHGAALAAVGHVVGQAVGRWLLSSADAYMSDAVYGTAASLDPLWSRDGLVVQTVGGGQDRATKLAALVDEPIAHAHLIVCWQNRPDATNCGRCAKCVRTSLQLLVLDALDRFTTLSQAVAPAHIASILAEPAHRIFIWEDLAACLRRRTDGHTLADAIDLLIDRSRRANRRPRPQDLTTREGRRIAREWLRRQVQPRLPVSLRRRLLPLHRRGVI